MAPLALYLAFIGASCAYAQMNWRRAWLLVLVCAVVQDPVRKLTPGSPVWISFVVVALYAAILFAARRTLLAHLREFGRRFPAIETVFTIFLFTLLAAASNGLVTFGVANWKVPLVSFVTYLVPLTAILLGYAWLQREETMYRFFGIYAALTSIALIGSMLEYLRFDSPVLGMVSFEGDYIRHLPGIQVRLLAGIYRGPDVMAWHAGMLTVIAVAMAMRNGFGQRMLLWGGVAGWGFLNCMLAGRRKAIYFVVVFGVVLLWRYIRQISFAQIVTALALLAVLGGVIRHLGSKEETDVYTRSAGTSHAEIAQRLEGGVMQTFRQFGLMGAGLGAATQGVHHLIEGGNLGWQEGGLGKIAVELGLPGMVARMVLGWVVLRLLLRLTSIGDVQGSSHFLRVVLFALAAANVAGFIAS
ncbi:MAG TPA: hypothetical protein VF701_05795, partial [Thermoanaerobaculia bacterium]